MLIFCSRFAGVSDLDDVLHMYLMLLDSGFLTADGGNPAASVFVDVASKLNLNIFFISY
jgi:hypothetical protein